MDSKTSMGDQAPPTATRARKARVSSRKGPMKRSSRFLLAVDSLPQPDLATAPRHVLAAWRMASLYVQGQGWTLCRLLPRQEQWWYHALALLLAQAIVETEHLTRCDECMTQDWEFLLAVPVRTPKDTAFDPEGNSK